MKINNPVVTVDNVVELFRNKFCNDKGYDKNLVFKLRNEFKISTLSIHDYIQNSEADYVKLYKIYSFLINYK